MKTIGEVVAEQAEKHFREGRADHDTRVEAPLTKDNRQEITNTIALIFSYDESVAPLVVESINPLSLLRDIQRYENALAAAEQQLAQCCSAPDAAV